MRRYLIAVVFCAGWLVMLAEDAPKPEAQLPTVEQLQKEIVQKDAAIAQLQAQLKAQGTLYGACFQSLVEAEQRAAKATPKVQP